MIPIIQIGPLAIQLPGLIILLGLWGGLNLSEKFSPNFKVDPNKIYNLVFIGLIFGLLGARLFYILRYPAVFLEAPFSIFSLNPGLLDPMGGFSTGIITALVYGQRKKMEFWSTLDSLTLFFAVIMVSWGFANFASGNGYGSITNLPWSIMLWGGQRHPTQIYETIFSLIILFYILPKGNKETSPIQGLFFLKFLAFSAGARLFLEAFHGDSYLIANGIRLIQVVSWTILAIALFEVEKRIKRHSNKAQEE